MCYVIYIYVYIYIERERDMICCIGQAPEGVEPHPRLPPRGRRPRGAGLRVPGFVLTRKSLGQDRIGSDRMLSFRRWHSPVSCQLYCTASMSLLGMVWPQGPGALLESCGGLTITSTIYVSEIHLKQTEQLHAQPKHHLCFVIC